jgi:hypothetical protein
LLYSLILHNSTLPHANKLLVESIMEFSKTSQKLMEIREVFGLFFSKEIGILLLCKNVPFWITAFIADY